MNSTVTTRPTVPDQHWKGGQGGGWGVGVEGGERREVEMDMGEGLWEMMVGI